MNKKILIFLIVIIIVIVFALIFLFYPKEMDLTETKITGEFIVTKGCMGIVNNTLLVDFANKCEEARQYEGKTVEVIGYTYKHKCRKYEQCFGGPYMKNIKSIQLIEDRNS